MRLRFLLLLVVILCSSEIKAQDCSGYFQLNELARGNKIDTTYQYLKYKDNVSFIKGNERIFLNVRTYGNVDISQTKWSVTIVFENGDQMDFNDVNVTSSANHSKGFKKRDYKYRATIVLSSEQLGKFKSNKIKSVTVHNSDARVTKGCAKRVMEIANCIEEL